MKTSSRQVYDMVWVHYNVAVVGHAHKMKNFVIDKMITKQAVTVNVIAGCGLTGS